MSLLTALDKNLGLKFNLFFPYSWLRRLPQLRINLDGSLESLEMQIYHSFAKK